MDDRDRHPKIGSKSSKKISQRKRKRKLEDDKRNWRRESNKVRKRS